jgi:hypothetical protein
MHLPADVWYAPSLHFSSNAQPPVHSIQILPLCPAAEAALTAEFKSHRVQKTYVALSRGVTPAHGRIDVKLKTISTIARHFAVPHPGGKEAVTEFKRVAVVQQQVPSIGPDVADDNISGVYSLLLVKPITGRMHQIRAHLNHIGHPLDGDGRCAHCPQLLHFVSQPTAMSLRYAPRRQGPQTSCASWLFLHSASIRTSFATCSGEDAGQCVWHNVCAACELPPQLKQRLAVLGGDEVGVEVAAAIQQDVTCSAASLSQ